MEPPSVKSPQAREQTARPPPAAHEKKPGDRPLIGQHKSDRVKCVECNLELKKKNLRMHLRRKHSDKLDTVSEERYLRSQCVDAKRGVFAVQKSFSGTATPVHVIKNTWSQTHRSECEVNQCNLNTDFACRSGLLPFECQHVRSLFFCPRANVPNVGLTEKTLGVMVQNHWFGEKRKNELLKKQEDAKLEDAPLSALVNVGGSQTKLHISVYEPSVSYYSRLGRVVVGYDAKKNTWHCPCTTSYKKACIHKAIGKWHLFETNRDLFKKVKSTEEQHSLTEGELSHSDNENDPNSDNSIERMLTYIMSHKRIPAELCKTLVANSRTSEFPKQLVPAEVTCKECVEQSVLCPPQLITCRARILTSCGIIEGMSQCIDPVAYLIP